MDTIDYDNGLKTLKIKNISDEIIENIYELIQNMDNKKSNNGYN